jgi:hypothetical protein
MTNRLLTNPDFSPGQFFCRADRPVQGGSVLKAATDDSERLFITKAKYNAGFRADQNFMQRIRFSGTPTVKSPAYPHYI